MQECPRATVAICYDFDGTLIPGNMQENSFLPNIEVLPEDFWMLVKKHAREHDMDEVLAYMQLMIEKARDAGARFTKAELAEHGSRLKLFPGVEGWFASVNEYCDAAGANVEHFVVSSGLQEMIDGSPIAKEFKHVFASGFVYDGDGFPVFAARSVNYTTKTQYLFRINKGTLNSWNNETINRYTPDEDRPQPFSRMIYIGDGETDVPAMKIVNSQGGYSIAVYPPEEGEGRDEGDVDGKRPAERLVADNRAKFAREADFRVDGPVYEVVTMLVRRIVDEYRLGMNLAAT